MGRRSSRHLNDTRTASCESVSRPFSIKMDQEELNKKYKPSIWNPDLTSDQVIEKYMRIAKECKAVVTKIDRHRQS